MTSNAPSMRDFTFRGAQRMERVRNPVRSSTAPVKPLSEEVSRTICTQSSLTVRPTMPCVASMVSPSIDTGPAQARQVRCSPVSSSRKMETASVSM